MPLPTPERNSTHGAANVTRLKQPPPERTAASRIWRLRWLRQSGPPGGKPVSRSPSCRRNWSMPGKRRRVHGIASAPRRLSVCGVAGVGATNARRAGLEFARPGFIPQVSRAVGDALHEDIERRSGTMRTHLAGRNKHRLTRRGPDVSGRTGRS